MRVLPAILLAGAPLLAAAAQDLRWTSSVGVPVRIQDLVLPGPRLEPVPQSFESPVSVRLLAARPHGDSFRYDLEVYGLDPGPHDLREYLADPTGAPLVELPPLTLEVTSVLPPGRVRPRALGAGEPPVPGGYRTTLFVLGALWIVGLVALVASGRRARRQEQAAQEHPQTAADRLRPLVERALAGELGQQERARLELNLIAFWRERLALADLTTAQALHRLREHDRAGPLLEALERWLHRPGSPDSTREDVEALLAPYRDVAASALGPAAEEVR